MNRGKTPSSPVPRGRLERLAHLCGLASRVAGGMVAEGLRQVARGNWKADRTTPLARIQAFPTRAGRTDAAERNVDT